MAKLVIGLCALYISYSTPLEVPFFVLPNYSEELNAASVTFRADVKSVINQAQMVETECDELLETLQDSAGSLQKGISDIVNNTVTEFGRDVNKLLNNVSIDVSECTALSSTIESRGTDILVTTNTCVHDKLEEAQMYIDDAISSIQYIKAHLDSIRRIVDENLNVTIKNTNTMTVLQSLTFLRAIYFEPSSAAFEISSISTSSRFGISRINSLMILDCVAIEAIASLVNNKLSVYSNIKKCIEKLHYSETDVLVNELRRR